jgi:hypothetical protein
VARLLAVEAQCLTAIVGADGRSRSVWVYPDAPDHSCSFANGPTALGGGRCDIAGQLDKLHE